MEESLTTARAAALDAIKRKKEAEQEEEIAIEKAEQAHEEAYTLQLLKSEIKKLLKVCEPVQHYNITIIIMYVTAPCNRHAVIHKCMLYYVAGRRNENH